MNPEKMSDEWLLNKIDEYESILHCGELNALESAYFISQIEIYDSILAERYFNQA